MTCAPSEDSDQHGHPPSLIFVRSMGSEGPMDSSCGQQVLRPDWADADHTGHFVGFVMLRLKYLFKHLSCSDSFIKF